MCVYIYIYIYIYRYRTKQSRGSTREIPQDSPSCVDTGNIYIYIYIYQGFIQEFVLGGGKLSER